MKLEVIDWLVERDGPGSAGAVAQRSLSDPERWSMLDRYADWLKTEGIPAGLLSPAEAPRIWERHIEDSFSFLAGWSAGPPVRVFDVGSGGGLPGVPIAVGLRDSSVVLVERSEKRARLLRRATRVIGLENVEVLSMDLRQLTECEAVVMRGVLTPPEAVSTVGRMLSARGTAVVGLAHRREPAAEWETFGGEVVKVPVLDPPGWLLIIRDSGE